MRRGPDGSGEWLSPDERVGLAHRRLSIIDLSDQATQPMHDQQRELVVTFNGEIYNYLSLRQRLEAKGYVFRTHSDTEVLLHLYADRGEEMVHDLRGMFAFAIWDGQQQSLFLARDRFGIKPLYYADDGWTFRFASQVKALMAGGRLSRDQDAAGLAGFFLLGSVPEPFTMYRAVRALGAGQTLRVGPTGPSEPRQYYSVKSIYEQASVASDHCALVTQDALTLAREALLDSVRHHLVADVPVGAFLSAGIDSSSIVGLMKDAGQNDILTITLAFEEFCGTDSDEAPSAEKIARHYGARHTTRLVGRAEFEEDLPAILEAMDQPSIDGINTWFVSKAARELGLKVAMSGLGGDELLGGYSSFQDVPRWNRLARPSSALPMFGQAVRMLLSSGAFELDRINPKAAGFFEYGPTFAGAYLLKRGLCLPWELSGLMRKEEVRNGLARLRPLEWLAGHQPSSASTFAKVAALETSTYMRNQLLRDTDWASMAHGLEVRVPLVDHVLLEQLSPLMVQGRLPPRKLALGRAPRRALPDDLFDRRKTGFSTPVASWLETKLDGDGQKIQMLSRRNCPWARRWAFVVASAFGHPMPGILS